MDHFYGGAIDDQGTAAIWERQSQDCYVRLQKDDPLPDPSSSFWDLEYQFCHMADPCTGLCDEASKNNVNVGDDDWISSSMFHEQTPINKHYADLEHHLSDPCTSLCAESSNNNVNVGDDNWSSKFCQQTPIKHSDLEYQFCDIADIIAKDFEEWNETSRAKRRRTLQFSPENVKMTHPMTEESELSQSPLNRLNRNTHVAVMEKAFEISAEPAQARPAMTKGAPNTCPPGKNMVTRCSEFIKPCNLLREVTMKDINEMIKAKPPHKNDEDPNSFQASAISGGKPMVHKRRIHALPPHKINHGNDKEPNSFQQVSAISGKLVVLKRTIHTKGNGAITITRTIG